ncbi:MAG: hypothetical protein GY854_06715 [Deltaproteobacteria bacterium]|nr:hypothetical protein [Deltaproteobacteria bacterium]
MNKLRDSLSQGKRTVFAVLFLSAFFLSAFSSYAHAADIKVLFVANGYYQQEYDIYYYLQDNNHEVDIKKDYRVKGSTDLTPYDSVIITGFAPNLSYSALSNIGSAGVPVLIVEYWDFWYSYRLGLLQWDSGDYYGTDTVTLINDQHPITAGFDQSIQVYNPWYVLYGASMFSISSGVTPLIYSWQSANEVGVMVDDARHIIATGIYDTTHFSADGWALFDALVQYLLPPPVEISWESAASAQSPFIFTSETSSGTLLATTDTTVWGIDSSGVKTEIVSVGNPTRFVLNTSGDTVGVFDGQYFRLYASNGTPIGTQVIPAGGYLVPIPGSLLLFSPEVEIFPTDGGRVIEGRIVDGNGAVQATFPAADLILARITSNHIYHITKSELVKTTVQGSEVWRIPQVLHNLEVSDTGDKIIAQSGEDLDTVIHFNNDTVVGTEALGNTVWNIAVSPSGEHSVATTHSRNPENSAVHFFTDGQLTRTLDLPVKYAISADISNDGYVVIGAQNLDYTGKIMLFNSFGNLVWEEEIATIDDNAWRPEVDFVDQGSAFVVRTKDGLSTYSIGE